MPSITITTTCPTWCDRTDAEHLVPDPLTERGAKHYGVDIGDQVLTHSRDIANPPVADGTLPVAIEQNELIRRGVHELAPVTVALYVEYLTNMTPAEARRLAEALLKAADEAERL